MNTTKARFGENLRIIRAIASKDIVEALRNRTILANIIITFLIIVAYKWFPDLVKLDDPFLMVYDSGDSRLLAELEKDPKFNPLRATTMQMFEEHMDDLDVRNLGLVIPADYNQTVDAGGQPVLDGYVLWSNRSAADDLRLDYEQQLSDLAGQPVAIDIKRTLYPSPDSMGSGIMTSATFVMAILFMGALVVPDLMFEEKRTRTLDVLLVSPASIGQAVMGKALAGLFYVTTATAVLFVVYSDFVVNWWLVILTFSCGALFAVGLGLLLGVLLETRQQMMIWTFPVFVPLLVPVFLSGLDPILPEALRAVIAWVPTVALAKVFRISFSEGAPLAEFGPELGLVVASAGLVLATVVWLVRRLDR